MMLAIRFLTTVAVALAFVPLKARGADETKPVEGGAGSAFQSKSYDIDAKGQVAVVLSFEAGKEVTVNTSADKDGDILVAA